MRKGHANWYFGLYKSNSLPNKRFSMNSFAELPLNNLSERAFGKRAEDFEQMLSSRLPSQEFWNTRYGGQDTRSAVINANIPILLTTGYNDFYVGGIFKMWNKMDLHTKRKSALLVSPYNHSDGYDSENGLCFPSGKRTEQFGAQYKIDWLDHVRKGTPITYEEGVITYYRTFENEWDSDFYKRPTELIKIGLGEQTVSFDYDPLTPTAFACEGCFANEANNETGSIRIYTKPLDRDVFIKGQMQAVLTVSSNCADTSFYARISIKKDQYTYVLRHDITSLSYQLGSYVENEAVKIKFCFDEHAFLLKKGECLQVDIASTDDNTYVSHTNHLGEYSLKTDAKIATNTVYLGDSYLLLPTEI
jgi:predicted acyl esterase